MRQTITRNEIWKLCQREFPGCPTLIFEDDSYACLSARDVRAVGKLFRRLQWTTSILGGLQAWRWTPRNDCENFARLAVCAASAWYAGQKDKAAFAPGWGTIKYKRRATTYDISSQGGEVDVVVRDSSDYHTVNVVLKEDGTLAAWEPQQRDFAPLTLEERLSVTQVIF